MSKLNKVEMALWEEYQFKVIPPFYYHIYKTGTIKRGDLEYKSCLFYSQTLYGDVQRGKNLCYDVSSNLKDLLDNTIDKYRLIMQQPVPDVWYEHGRYYIKGYAVYENGRNSYIFLEDGCQTNVYSYPNGDICIFIGNERIVIANSMEFWERFKKSPKYVAKYNKTNNIIGPIILIILFILFVLVSVFISEAVDFIFGM